MTPTENKRPQVTETVLVVEDEVLIRLSISQYLRDCGYRVIEAANADEAILVLQDGMRVDVVLTDVQMAGTMDGFGLSQWVRSNRPGLEVILAGSVNRAVSAAADLCEENNGVIAKPYDPQVVLDRIRRLLASKTARERD